jgi:flavin reductase (DIM6/NTAB) family NADH-FMN oxidoreductase RutF
VSENDYPLDAGFRQGMARLAAGVSIVGAACQDAKHGMAASSVTSVSVRPPTLLVCLSTDTRTFNLVRTAGRFAVSVLRADQRGLVDLFAGRDPGGPADRFGRVRHQLTAAGNPVLVDALAWFDCRTEAIYPGGDTHAIIVGRVLATGFAADPARAEPLVWFNREAHRLARLA